MIDFEVSKNDAGKRLDNLLVRVVPDCPKSLIYKAFRKKDVKVNGKRADISYQVKTGDVVKAYLPADIAPAPAPHRAPAFIKAGKSLDVIYEDENILIINKPAGLICHSDKNTFDDTLVDRVKRYLYENGEYDPENEHSFSPALCNRIDRNTCGLVIAAKNALALRTVNEKIKNREISKYYYCIVTGQMPKSHDVLTGYITKDELTNTVTVSAAPKEHSNEIITEYSVLKYEKGLSLLSIHLITGRTHQIRAHLAFIGHPIAGDPKYGKKATGKAGALPFQALGSCRIAFDFSSDAGELNYLDKKEFYTDSLWFLKELMPL